MNEINSNITEILGFYHTRSVNHFRGLVFMGNIMFEKFYL